MENILRVKNVEKYYGNKSSLTKAINNISFEVEKGEFVAIMGASGSGKTTLLNCISTIDKVTAGEIFVDGENITVNEKDIAWSADKELKYKNTDDLSKQWINITDEHFIVWMRPAGLPNLGNYGGELKILI